MAAMAAAAAQIARGRMREFFQCDLDIAGAYPGMAADAEVVSVRAPSGLQPGGPCSGSRDSWHRPTLAP